MNKLKETKFGKKVNEVWNNKFFGLVYIRLGLLAILLNIVVEALSRHSFYKSLGHIIDNPLAFIYNCLLIFLTLTIVPFFKRRIFVGFVVSAFWLFFGVANCVMLSFRVTPFTAPDMKNMTDGLKIINQYMSTFQLVLVCLGILLLLAAIVFIAIKTPKIKEKVHLLISALAMSIAFGVVMLLTNIGPKVGFLSENFGNIANAYKDYGFGYCFFSSVFNSGIDKPKGYGEDAVDEVIDDVETKVPEIMEDVAELDEEEYPNIVFVQLESLFDPTHIKGMEFSEEPLPYLNYLYENYPSGYLSMPSFGAGTANTEFEVMTGMNLDDFGPGEYPYKTILKESACESICYDLKNYGYTTNVIHNNEADFYQRNQVFGRLGYDNFISIEYIEEYDLTPTGWCTDDCLVGEITGILKASKEQDFIYTISVEGHGAYVPVTEDMNMNIEVTNDSVTGDPEGFEYYVNLIHNMDAFVENLVTEVSKIDEKTVIVFFGDHLPTFDITDDELTNGDIFQTQYVIWNNFDMKKNDKDIQAYQLSSLVLSRLGITGGVISKYHVANLDKEIDQEYLDKLELLEYDLLYGECLAYGGEKPYVPTNLHMGYKDITISEVVMGEDGVTIKGSNYTRCSKLKIGKEVYSTEFISNSELYIKDVSLKAGDKIAVVQEDENGDIISTTSMFVIE